MRQAVQGAHAIAVSRQETVVFDIVVDLARKVRHRRIDQGHNQYLLAVAQFGFRQKTRRQVGKRRRLAAARHSRHAH